MLQVSGIYIALLPSILNNLECLIHFVSEKKSLTRLVGDANNRIKAAFRPKTRRCYKLLFRLFVGFCLCSGVDLCRPDLSCVIAYLEFLVENKVSVNMIANHVSALQAQFIIYGLPFHILEHPKIKYFQKSLKINRPPTSVTRNIMSLQMLSALVHECSNIPFGRVFKSIFLIAFFVFLRVSNLDPHAIPAFDPTRHLTLGDIKIHPKCMHIKIKWSKTMQTRDKVHVVVLPRLIGSPLCPVRALEKTIKLYSPGPDSPMFQIIY